MDFLIQPLARLIPAQEFLLPLLVLQGETGEGGDAATPGPFAQFLPFILIGALAWFLLIAPERKRQKERMGMLAAIKKNDKVVTTGGLIATVTKVDDAQLTLRIADGVHVHVERHAVARVVQVAPSKEDKADE